MSSTKTDTLTLSQDELDALVDARIAALVERDKQAIERGKQNRATIKGLLETHVGLVVTSGVPPTVFERSGAHGWQTGGKFVVNGVEFTANSLVRVTSTIPAKEKSAE